jgi:hypothetical protein
MLAGLVLAPHAAPASLPGADQATALDFAHQASRGVEGAESVSAGVAVWRSVWGRSAVV